MVLEHVPQHARASRRSRRGGRRRRTRPPRSGRDRRSGGSRAARRCRSRSAGRRCSGPSPCRGSGRSDRSASPGRPGAAPRSGAAPDSRSWPNGFSTTARTQPLSTRASPSRPGWPGRWSRRPRAASRSRRCGCADRPAGLRSPRAPPSASDRAPDRRSRPRTYLTMAGRSPGRPWVGGVNSFAPSSRRRRKSSSEILGSPDPDDREVRRDRPVAVEVGDRRGEQAARQVSRGAEDDERAGRTDLFFRPPGTVTRTESVDPDSLRRPSSPSPFAAIA